MNSAYIGNETFTVKKQETDKEGQILILCISANDMSMTSITITQKKSRSMYLVICLHF